MNVCETQHTKSLVAIDIIFFALAFILSSFTQTVSILTDWTVSKEEEEGEEGRKNCQNHIRPKPLSDPLGRDGA